MNTPAPNLKGWIFKDSDRLLHCFDTSHHSLCNAHTAPPDAYFEELSVRDHDRAADRPRASDCPHCFLNLRARLFPKKGGVA